jgi:hypothetical protein
MSRPSVRPFAVPLLLALLVAAPTGLAFAHAPSAPPGQAIAPPALSHGEHRPI